MSGWEKSINEIQQPTYIQMSMQGVPYISYLWIQWALLHTRFSCYGEMTEECSNYLTRIGFLTLIAFDGPARPEEQ